ncbi:hypothetical protein [Lactococcus ileimucosae]|uniref:hypothetical protein n=1 Tax=Lactococcus ileimucosae TaxID=2941329 RepID=UPI0035147F28
MSPKQKIMQEKLRVIKSKQKKMAVQTGKQIQNKGLKKITKPYGYHTHYSIGF